MGLLNQLQSVAVIILAVLALMWVATNPATIGLEEPGTTPETVALSDLILALEKVNNALPQDEYQEPKAVLDNVTFTEKQDEILLDTNNIEANTDDVETILNALESKDYATQTTLKRLDRRIRENQGLYGGIDVNNRQNLFHVEPTVPLNHLRNDWTGNATWTGQTYKLTGNGYIDSSQRGEYQPGSTAEWGEMIMVKSVPNTPGEEAEWGYKNSVNGFYFGVNTTCTYVEILKENEVLESACQDDWNVNTLNTTEETSYNPAGEKLVLADANMYQGQFAWYGGGLLELGVIIDNVDTDDGQNYHPVHRFDIQNATSMGEVSLPLTMEITGDADNSTVLELGGRQYSILDDYNPTARVQKEIRESMTASGSEYTPAISFRVPAEYSNVNLDLISFSATPDCDVNAQVRYDTVLDSPVWEVPSLISRNESLVEVDTSATNWSVGGEPSGYFLDLAQLPGGDNKNKPVASVQTERVSAPIGESDVVTLGFKADATSCTVNDITVEWREDY